MTRREPQDIERGRAATQRVLREGVLDLRYKPASRRVTALICALPIVIVVGIELYRRRFLGKEPKVRSIQVTDAQTEVDTKTEREPA